MQPSLIPLESIQIASPCRADWNAMQPVRGQDCIRFCPGCGKNVYDLSGLTRDEGMRLIAEKESRPCLRIHRRKDGTVITSDCPVGQAKARKRGQIAVMFAAITGLAAAVFGLANVFIHRLPAAPKLKLPAPSAVTSPPLMSRPTPPKQELVRTPERAPVVEALPTPAPPVESMTIPNTPDPSSGVSVTMGAPMPMPIPTPSSDSPATKPLESDLTNSPQ